MKRMQIRRWAAMAAACVAAYSLSGCAPSAQAVSGGALPSSTAIVSTAIESIAPVSSEATGVSSPESINPVSEAISSSISMEISSVVASSEATLSSQTAQSKPSSASSSSRTESVSSKPASSVTAPSSSSQKPLPGKPAGGIFDEYTSQYVKKLKEAYGEGQNRLILTLLTDTHEHLQMLRTTANNISAVTKQVPSAALIHMGDVIDGNKAKPDSLKLLNQSMGILSSTGLPVLVARGNHDDNSYQPDKSYRSIISNEEWYQLTQKNTETVEGVVRQEHSPNFYRDIAQSKVRLIILSYDNGNPGGSLDELPGINGKTYWGFDFNTVYWLGKIALQNLPEDWQVAVFSHFPTRKELCSYNKQPVNGLAVEGILQAFTQGGSYAAKELTGGVGNETIFTFEKQGKRSVIAFFYGHNHADLVQKPAGINFFYISTANSSSFAQANPSILPPGSFVPSPRIFGTVTENCWESLVVDTAQRTVKLLRYGAGNDRTISY